jgi:hypothetical protein
MSNEQDRYAGEKREYVPRRCPFCGNVSVPETAMIPYPKDSRAIWCVDYEILAECATCGRTLPLEQWEKAAPNQTRTITGYSPETRSAGILPPEED